MYDAVQLELVADSSYEHRTHCMHGSEPFTVYTELPQPMTGQSAP